MDWRVAIIRFWLLLAAAVVYCWHSPATWFAIAPALILTPIVWLRTTGGVTGVLIHPDDAGGVKVAIGDSTDPTCACCVTSGCPAICSTEITELTIDISGMANVGCSDCADYDGTYVVARDSACVGANFVATGPCTCPGSSTTDYNVVWFFFDHGTGDTILQVSLSIGNDININLPDGFFWRHTIGTKPQDCTGLSSQDVPFLMNNNLCSTTGLCDASGATCTVTSDP